MAKYLLMKKVSENEVTVVYQFGPNEDRMGVIEFNKNEQRFAVIKSVDDGIISNGTYEKWAAGKIARVKREDRPFPAVMSVEA